MRKYVDENTACLIYKQMIVPLSDYADIIVKSGPMGEVSWLDRLHERAVKIIDNKQHRGMSIDGLINFYRLKPVTKRQDEHLYSTMYRLSTNPNLIDEERPEIHLRVEIK